MGKHFAYMISGNASATTASGCNFTKGDHNVLTTCYCMFKQI